MVRRAHNYEKESEAFYDRLADHFDDSFDGFLASFFKKFILKQLEYPQNSRLLDVGCANGRLLEMLNHKQALEGTGLDISSNMVKIARIKHPDHKFIQGNAQSLPFEDASYDVITCSASFHHFPDPDRFLEEARRVLASGGKLVIAEIHLPVITRLYNWRLNRFSTEGDVKVYTSRELRQKFEKQGWQLLRKKIFFQIQYYEITPKAKEE